MGWLIVIGIIIIICFISWVAELYKKGQIYERMKPDIDNLNKARSNLGSDKVYFEITKKEWENKKKKDIEEMKKLKEQTGLELEEQRRKWSEEMAQSIEEINKLKDEQKIKFSEKMTEGMTEIRKLADEKTSGFPWLAEAYADYFYLKSIKEAKYLENKLHPALKSAEKVQEIARERRTVEKKLRIAQGIIKYYQDLFPFLEDWLDEREDELLKMVLKKDVDEPLEKVVLYWERGEDPVGMYLSKEEYQKLSPTERNQLALDKYWTKAKNRFEAGRIYERYIGYLYETQGYDVYYQGILEGRGDLGRDLVCKKGNKTAVIQCKRWSLVKHKIIHENHINQLFGTATKYRIECKKREKAPTLFKIKEDITPILYTTTEVSDKAKEFANALGVKIYEKFPFEQYPSIKCNISRKNGEKIYHLPFDQQYDRTFVEEERLEKYVETVAEAEKLGFRRAFRWRGNNEK